METTSEMHIDSKSFDKIDFQQLRDIFGSALMDAADLIKKKAQSNLTGGLSTMKKGVVSELSNDALKSRVRIRKGSTENYSTSIANETDFRLLFFDQGTVPRYINVKGGRKSRSKKMEAMANSGERKGYRGQITANNFFSNAINQTQSQAEKLIKDRLEKDIQNLFNKS